MQPREGRGGNSPSLLCLNKQALRLTTKTVERMKVKATCTP